MLDDVFDDSVSNGPTGVVPINSPASTTATATMPVPVVTLDTANVDVPYIVGTVRMSPTEYPVPVLTTIALTTLKTNVP